MVTRELTSWHRHEPINCIIERFLFWFPLLFFLRLVLFLHGRKWYHWTKPGSTSTGNSHSSPNRRIPRHDFAHVLTFDPLKTTSRLPKILTPGSPKIPIPSHTQPRMNKARHHLEVLRIELRLFFRQLGGQDVATFLHHLMTKPGILQHDEFCCKFDVSNSSKMKSDPRKHRIWITTMDTQWINHGSTSQLQVVMTMYYHPTPRYSTAVDLSNFQSQSRLWSCNPLLLAPNSYKHFFFWLLYDCIFFYIFI